MTPSRTVHWDLSVFRCTKSRKVTDIGISYLSSSSLLEKPALGSTQISDVGLSYLGNLANLKDISFKLTKFPKYDNVQ